MMGTYREYTRNLVEKYINLIYYFYMNYSKALKALREKLLLSQTDLAKMIGVTYVSVNRWENGRHEPSYKAKRMIHKLCQKNDIEIEKEGH
jgi:DNA-binding transcriptional regulator YiaG